MLLLNDFFMEACMIFMNYGDYHSCNLVPAEKGPDSEVYIVTMKDQASMF